MKRPRLLLVAELVEPIPRTPVHRFDSWVIIWYSRGHGTASFSGQDLPIRPGVALCVPPGTPYAEESADGFISLWIVADGLPLPLDGPVAFDLAADRRFSHAARLMLEEYRMRCDGWQEACASQLSTVLRCLRQLPGEFNGQGLVDRLTEIMRQHAQDPAFTASAAMRRLPVTSQRVRQIFRQVSGGTPTQYLRELRISQAKHLLRLSDLPIAEVAGRSGFSDQFYFSRVFRQVVGLSPRRFRDS